MSVHHRWLCAQEEKDGGRTIYHYMFKQWPDHGEPQNVHHVLDFIADFQRRQRDTGMRGPVVMHCR